MKKIIFISLLILSGCAPGKMIGTGYLVTVQRGIRTEWQKVETAQQADQFVHQHTGLSFNTDTLLGSYLPFWTFRNGTLEIYVEKKGIYEKKTGAKKRWKIYDKELAK